MRNKIIATLGVFVVCGLSYATQQVINNSPAGGGTGDTLYTAFGKVNDNFDELYANMTNYVSFTNTITGFTNTITSFSASQLTNANAYGWRDGLELWEQVTNTTALGWRSALALGEQTTNTTAAAWRSALALSENTTNANVAIAAGTSGYLPIYISTNSIGDSTILKSGANYGVDGGWHIGTAIGAAGDNNLLVDGNVGIGITPLNRISLYLGKSFINPTSDSYGLYNSSIFGVTTNSSLNWYGSFTILNSSYVGTGATNSGRIFGSYVNAAIDNANHLGVAEYLYGKYIKHGLDATSPGTVNNSYGLMIEGSRAGGTVGTLWGVYESGNDKNYFGATATGFGTTSPAAKVAINGGLHVGGDSDPGDNNVLVDGYILRECSPTYPYYLDLQSTGTMGARLKTTAAGGAYYYSDCFDGTAAGLVMASNGTNKWVFGSFGADVATYLTWYSVADSKNGMYLFSGSAPYLSIPNGGLHVGGTSNPGDNNIVVDGNSYVAGTNYATVVRGTNYLSNDGSLGGTMTFTNYTRTSDDSGMITNVWSFKNGLFITNTITQ